MNLTQLKKALLRIIGTDNQVLGRTSGDVGGVAVTPGAGTITSAMLKTTTGSVQTASPTFVNLTLPGGSYGFYPQIRATNGSSPEMQASIAGTVDFPGTSYTTNIQLAATDGTDPRANAQQRYVQS